MKGVQCQLTSQLQICRRPAALGHPSCWPACHGRPMQWSLHAYAWALGAMQLLPMPRPHARPALPTLNKAAPASSTDNSRPDPTCG